jgi:hypothetical protein
MLPKRETKRKTLGRNKRATRYHEESESGTKALGRRIY